MNDENGIFSPLRSPEIMSPVRFLRNASRTKLTALTPEPSVTACFWKSADDLSLSGIGDDGCALLNKYAVKSMLQDPILHLFPDHIGPYLSSRDLCNCRLVSRKMNHAAVRPSVWKSLLQTEYRIDVEGLHRLARVDRRRRLSRARLADGQIQSPAPPTQPSPEQPVTAPPIPLPHFSDPPNPKDAEDIFDDASSEDDDTSESQRRFAGEYQGYSWRSLYKQLHSHQINQWKARLSEPRQAIIAALNNGQLAPALVAADALIEPQLQAGVGKGSEPLRLVLAADLTSRAALSAFAARQKQAQTKTAALAAVPQPELELSADEISESETSPRKPMGSRSFTAAPNASPTTALLLSSAALDLSNNKIDVDDATLDCVSCDGDDDRGAVGAAVLPRADGAVSPSYFQQQQQHGHYRGHDLDVYRGHDLDVYRGHDLDVHD